MQSALEEIRAWSQPPGSPGLACTFDRRYINTAVVPAATGVMGMTAIWLPAGLTVTNINVISGGTAAGTNTHFWLALYRQDLTLMAQSTDDTGGTTPAANTKVTKALTTAQVTTYSGMHYIGASQTATTVATLLGLSGPAANIAMNDTPLIAGTTGSALVGVAPATAAALAAQIFSLYAYVT